MANTTKKTATKEPCEIQQEMTVPAETEAKEAPVRAVKSKTIKLDDTLRVVVQSNVHGGLIFINRRTGDKTEWDNFGDKQTLTMGDLRSMKGSQRAFFENNWIFVDSIDEEGYEDVTPEDVYKALELNTCVNGRKVYGGPSAESVQKQIELIRQFVGEHTK